MAHLVRDNCRWDVRQSRRPFDDALAFRGCPARQSWLRALTEAGVRLCNHGVAAFGQPVEDITGGAFEEHVLEHVLEPLVMFHTDYPRSERVRDEDVYGYRLNRIALASQDEKQATEAV